MSMSSAQTSQAPPSLLWRIWQWRNRSCQRHNCSAGPSSTVHHPVDVVTATRQRWDRTAERVVMNCLRDLGKANRDQRDEEPRAYDVDNRHRVYMWRKDIGRVDRMRHCKLIKPRLRQVALSRWWCDNEVLWMCTINSSCVQLLWSFILCRMSVPTIIQDHQTWSGWSPDNFEGSYLLYVSSEALPCSSTNMALAII